MALSLDDIKEHTTEKLYDQPKRSYLWIIELPDISQDPEDMESAAEGDSDGDDPDDFNIDDELRDTLTHRITSVSLPFVQFETSQMPYQNRRKHYAEAFSVNNQMSLDVIDGDENAALRYFLAWQNLIKNEDGTFNPPSFYKRTIKYRHFATDLEKILEVKYKGCFPVSIDDLSLDYETNNLVQLSISIQCDEVKSEDYEIYELDREKAYGLGFSDKDIEEYVFKVDDLSVLMQSNLAQQILNHGPDIPNLPI